MTIFLTSGIGFNGDLPWPRLPEDMARFKNVTVGTPSEGKRNAVIMGRKTWLSIPVRSGGLSSRIEGGFIVLNKLGQGRVGMFIENPNCWTPRTQTFQTCYGITS